MMMRALQVLVVVMGVLIVAGVATIAVVLTRRAVAMPEAAADTVLQEPDGSRIAESGVSGDRLVVRLQGGGPDRVVVMDLHSGRILARAALAR